MTRFRTVRRRLTVAAVACGVSTSLIVGATTINAGQAQAEPGGTALVGKTVFLDPGHQGGSAGQRLNKQVDDGRGGKKDCQTTGATAVTGAKEHTVNWDVAQMVKAGLESQGAKVVLSRKDDRGWGGCVDERAAAASRSGADLAVSLHADSTSTATDEAKKGFHMIVPTLPIPDAEVNKAQTDQGRKASSAMRDAFVKAGFTPANYGGAANGIATRSDIAALNLTKVPAVFVEMGNLSNPKEAETLSGREGQLKYALAITDGVVSYVTGAATNPATPDEAAPEAEPAPAGEFDGLAALVPFISQLVDTDDPEEILQMLSTDGQDVFSQVLKAMLEVVYGLFGGKLPI